MSPWVQRSTIYVVGTGTTSFPPPPSLFPNNQFIQLIVWLWFGHQPSNRPTTQAGRKDPADTNHRASDRPEVFQFNNMLCTADPERMRRQKASPTVCDRVGTYVVRMVVLSFKQASGLNNEGEKFWKNAQSFGNIWAHWNHVHTDRHTDNFNSTDFQTRTQHSQLSFRIDRLSREDSSASTQSQQAACHTTVRVCMHACKQAVFFTIHASQLIQLIRANWKVNIQSSTLPVQRTYVPVFSD